MLDLWPSGLRKNYRFSQAFKKKKKTDKKIKLIDGDIFRRKINNYKYDKKSRKKVSHKYQYLINFIKNYF